MWVVQKSISGPEAGAGQHRPRVLSSDSDPALDEYFMTTGFLWLYIKWPKTVLLAPVFAPDHPRGPEVQEHLDEAEHEAAIINDSAECSVR